MNIYREMLSLLDPARPGFGLDLGWPDERLDYPWRTLFSLEPGFGAGKAPAWRRLLTTRSNPCGGL